MVWVAVAVGGYEKAYEKAYTKAFILVWCMKQLAVLHASSIYVDKIIHTHKQQGCDHPLNHHACICNHPLKSPSEPPCLYLQSPSEITL